MLSINTVYWGRISVLLSVIALLLLFAYGLLGPMGPGRIVLRRYSDELDTSFSFLRMTVVPTKVVGWQATILLAMIGLAVALRRWEPAALSVVVIPIPWLWLENKVMRRVAAIEAQADIWLFALANALRASPSLGKAISSTIAVTEAPLSQELETLMKDYALGTPMDEALTHLGQRCRSRVMVACLQALRVARNSGGNLTDTLESAAAALRELARLEAVVRTKTAEGKMQAWVIGIIPLPLLSVINWIDPEYLSPLWETFYGNVLAILAAFLFVTAILLANKICAVDV